MSEFNGTNPLLEALGDQPTVRDVTLFNQSYKKIIEPLTGIHIQPGQTAVIRVTGDAAFNQIKGNVDQLKALKDYDVLAMSVDVVDEPSNSWTLLIATLTPVDENGEIKTEWLDTDENITYRLDLQFDGGVVQVNNVLVNTQDVTLYDGIASLNLQIDKSQIEEATHNGVAGLYPVQNSVDIQSPNEMVTGIQLVYANPIMIQPTAQLYLTPWDEVNQEPLTTVMTGSQINVRVGVEFGSVPFDIDLFYQSTSGSNNQAQFFEGMSFTAYVSGNPGANQAFYFETSSASGVIREVNIASVEIVEVPPEEV